MTENEKLRELLAEARKIVHTILDIDALHGWACESDDDEPAMDDLMRDLRARIDAALAEPVSDSTAVRLQRVRKALTAAVPADGTIGNADDVSRVARLVAERDEARAEFAAAYQRGSEAMREAAAGKAYTTLSLHDEPCRRSELRQAVVHAIEALPIPEGQP